MPEPSIGIVNEANEAIHSLWEKNTIYLACLLTINSVSLIVFCLAWHYNFSVAEKLPDGSGIVICSLEVALVIMLIFRIVDTKGKSQYLIFHVQPDGDPFAGWRTIDIASHARHEFDGRDEAPILSQQIKISNVSNSDIEICRYEIVPVKPKSKARDASLDLIKIEKNATKTIDVHCTLSAPIPSENDPCIVKIVLYDQFGKSHILKKLKFERMRLYSSTKKGQRPIYCPSL